jgi:hypothetical protein
MGALADARAGLKDNLAARMSRYSVFGYEHKSPPAYSIIVSWPDMYDPRVTMAGDIDLIIPVRVEIPWQDDKSSDAELEEAMDTIVAAIEWDRTLGGTVGDLSCASFTDIGSRVLPNESVIMTFTVPVEILV